MGGIPDYHVAGGQKKDLRRYEAEALVKLMCTLDDIGAWSSEKKDREPDTNGFYSLWEVKERLPSSILFTNSMGTKLITEYVKKFLCTKEKRPSSERKEAGLTKACHTVEENKVEYQKLYRVATSTHKATVRSSGTKKRLILELDRLRKYCAEVPVLKEKEQVDTFASTLVDWRKKVFTSDKSVQGKIEEEVRDEYFGKCDEPRRSAELTRPFFAHKLTGANETVAGFGLTL